MASAARYKGYRYPIEVIGHAVAVSPFRAECARRRGVDGCPRCGGHLRDDPVLVCEVRAGLRCPVPSAAAPPRRQMAPRRGFREDQRRLPITCGARSTSGDVLDVLVRSRRNAVAAERFFRKLRKGLRYVPRVLVTDKLASYELAQRERCVVTHHRSKYLNRRAENSHQPTGPRTGHETLRLAGQANGSCLRSAASESTFGPVVI